MRPASSLRLSHPHQGFTLLEILVVMGIIGILSTVSYFGSIKNVQKQKLQEAGAQLLNDLTSARNQAIRTSANSTVTLDSTSASSPKGTYTINWIAPGSGATAASNQSPQPTLPNGVTVAPYASGSTTYPNTVTYTSPYAESSATGGAVWKLTNPTSGDVLYLKLIGMTGKGVLSAQP